MDKIDQKYFLNSFTYKTKRTILTLLLQPNLHVANDVTEIGKLLLFLLKDEWDYVKA